MKIFENDWFELEELYIEEPLFDDDDEDEIESEEDESDNDEGYSEGEDDGEDYEDNADSSSNSGRRKNKDNNESSKNNKSKADGEQSADGKPDGTDAKNGAKDTNADTLPEEGGPTHGSPNVGKNSGAEQGSKAASGGAHSGSAGASGAAATEGGAIAAEGGVAAAEGGAAASASGAAGATAGAAGGTAAVGGVFAAIWPVLLVILIIVVAIIVVSGFVMFLLTMPSIILGNVKNYAVSFYDGIINLAIGEDKNVKMSQVIEVADYIESMGYDLHGAGFLSDEIEGSKGNFKTKHTNESISYKWDNFWDKKSRKLDPDENIYADKTGVLRDTQGIVYIDSDYITKYLMSDNYMYIIKNNNKSFKGALDTFKNDGVLKFLHGFISDDWGRGMLHLMEENGSFGTIKGPYGSFFSKQTLKKLLSIITLGFIDGNIQIDVNRAEQQLVITSHPNGFWNAPTKFSYSLEGWTGRYGMPLEFLLSVHLTSMQPGLANDLANRFETEVQIALHPIKTDIEGGAKVGGGGEILSYEQLLEKAEEARKKEAAEAEGKDGETGEETTVEETTDRTDSDGATTDPDEVTTTDSEGTTENTEISSSVYESYAADASLINHSGIDTFIPYIYQVKDHWFRDVYFISDTDQEIIKNDEEYEKTTGERWTDYEIEDVLDEKYSNGGLGNVQYKLYTFEYAADGTITGEKLYNGTIEEAEKAGIKVHKKAKTKDISSVKKGSTEAVSGKWSAYELNSSGSSSGWSQWDNTQANKSFSNPAEHMYFQITTSESIEQIADGQRGPTNDLVKKMFTWNKYYTYNGTEERAEAIDNDRFSDSVKNEIEKYENGESGTKINSSEKDPRDANLIETFSVDKNSLAAFDILTNMNTLDADAIYRDFKELIVELNFFDKEELTNVPVETFEWPIPQTGSGGWPIRRFEKDENEWGTLIHSKLDLDYLTDIEKLEKISIAENLNINIDLNNPPDGSTPDDEKFNLEIANLSNEEDENSIITGETTLASKDNLVGSAVQGCNTKNLYKVYGEEVGKIILNNCNKYGGRSGQKHTATLNDIKALGGIFSKYVSYNNNADLKKNDKKFNYTVRTVQEFQDICTYVFSLMTIFGFEYGNGEKHVAFASNGNSSNNVFTDEAQYSYYYGTSCFDYSYNPIETTLNDEGLSRRENCNVCCDICYYKCGILPMCMLTCGNKGDDKLVKYCGATKIYNVKDLKVGDVLIYNEGGSYVHTEWIGEIDEDGKITIYNGGSSQMMWGGKFKRFDQNEYLDEKFKSGELEAYHIIDLLDGGGSVYEGYEPGQLVVSPVTGIVIDAGMTTPNKATNIETDKKESVGYIKIRALDDIDYKAIFKDDETKSNKKNTEGYKYFLEEYQQSNVTGTIIYMEGFSLELLKDKDTLKTGEDLSNIKDDEGKIKNLYTVQKYDDVLSDEAREILEKKEDAKKDAGPYYKTSAGILIKEGTALGTCYGNGEDTKEKFKKYFSEKIEELGLDEVDYKNPFKEDESDDYQDNSDIKITERPGMTGVQSEKIDNETLKKYGNGNNIRIIMRTAQDGTDKTSEKDSVIENVEEYIEVDDPGKKKNEINDMALFYWSPYEAGAWDRKKSGPEQAQDHNNSSGEISTGIAQWTKNSDFDEITNAYVKYGVAYDKKYSGLNSLTSIIQSGDASSAVNQIQSLISSYCNEDREAYLKFQMELCKYEWLDPESGNVKIDIGGKRVYELYPWAKGAPSVVQGTIMSYLIRRGSYKESILNCGVDLDAMQGNYEEICSEATMSKIFSGDGDRAQKQSKLALSILKEELTEEDIVQWVRKGHINGYPEFGSQ
ncbi:MAG: hypothetical protein K6D97_03510 [Clostridia bacterium]|nr:hypothetical protein [Clostridia bacterium]